MLHSLRTRLILASALVVIVAVGAIALFGIRVTNEKFTEYEEHRGLAGHLYYATLLTEYYSGKGGWTNVQPEIEQIEQASGRRVILVNAGGRIVADSSGEWNGQPWTGDWGNPAARIFFEEEAVGTLYVEPIRAAGSSGSDLFLDPVNRALIFIAAGAGLLAVLLLAGLARRILAPVEALTKAAQTMEAGDLSRRVEVTSHDEIGVLAHAFNRMADGLAHLEGLRRQMVTDISHELRTPLSNIRGYIEALRDGVLQSDPRIIESVYEEVMLLQGLVDDLQELSLAEAGQLRLERRSLAVDEAVEKAVVAARPRAQARQVSLSSKCPKNLPPVDADPQRIGQVLRNLLDNAMTHTPPGGKIEITAGSMEHGVEIRIRDEGSGITPEDLPFIFERFYRADKSRARATGGAGLGLAIVKQVIEAHGGTIRVESTAGRGTTFFITLPIYHRS